MSNKYLALTALAAAMGVSPFAAANITSVAQFYATENTLSSNANGTPADVVASGTGQVLRVTGTLNTSISSGDTKYIRFDLSPDARIFTDPVSGSQAGDPNVNNVGPITGTLQLPSTTNCPVAAANISTTLVSEIGPDRDYVIFQVENKCGFDFNQTWSFELEDVSISVQVDQDITYSVFETLRGAQDADPLQLVTTDTATWFRWQNGCNVECGLGDDWDRARIATDARFWVGDDPQAPVPPAALAVFEATGFPTANTHRADGELVAFFNDCYHIGGIQAAVLGSMDSFNQTDNASGVFPPIPPGAIAGNIGTNPLWRSNLGDLAPTDYNIGGVEGAYWWPPAAFANPAGYEAELVFQPTGLLFLTRPQMRASNYTLQLTTNNTRQGSLTNRPYFGVRTDTQACGAIRYAGSTDELVFGQTPQAQGGLFRQLIRITNPASLEADVMVTVYNDLGERSDFNLSDITGEDVLGPQSSTPLFAIDAFYDAAVAANPDFGLAEAQGPGAKDKLRIVVRSSAGNDALDGSSILDGQGGTPLADRAADGVSIQAFLISRDSQSFIQNK